MRSEETSETKKTPRRFPVRLRQERELHGWTQNHVARSIGTTQANVSNWERGTIVPGPYYRQKLGELFGKSLEELGLVGEEMQEDSAQPVTEPAPLSSRPIWNVPYRRNAFFTGREETLNLLTSLFKAKQVAALTQTQAISGLGGIGKTQIAVEFAYRFRHAFDAVLWATASSRDTLIADYLSIAKLLELSQQGESDEETEIARVKNWLAAHTNWLLILDNVDDLALIRDYLPAQSEGSSILLTTRLRALGDVAESVEIDKMAADEGILFLLRRAKLLSQDEPIERCAQSLRDLAAEVVSLVDGLPLALDQAGAYIEETGCSLQRYLDLYHTHRKELLQRRGTQSLYHPESVTATWSLSFRHIEQENAVAAELLRLCAFLYAEAIPEDFIVEGASELGPVPGAAATDPLILDAAIEKLLGYSLIRRNPDERTLSMHRLVQTVLKDDMDRELRRTWAERAVRMLNFLFPKVEPATWEACRRCLPHAQLVVEYIAEYDFHFPEAAQLLHKVAAYMMDHAQYRQVESLLKQALAIQQQSFPSESPEITAVLNDLGRFYYLQAEYQRAEPLLQQVLETRQRLWGTERFDTTVSLNNLALLFYAQGRYRQTEQYFNQALTAQRQLFGEHHPEIARTKGFLAELYTVRGRYNEAESLYKQVLEDQEQVYGKAHLEVARTLTSLASMYRSKGEYEVSEPLYEQALRIREKVWGSDHPDVAQTVYDLARLYRAQGKYADAEHLYLRALNIRQTIFGLDHPHVAQSLYGLGKLYFSLGKYEEALDYCQRALDIQERWLGEVHPTVAYTLITLAMIYMAQREYDRAEDFFNRALTVREHSLGADHPLVAVALNSLAEVYQAQGKYQEALPLIERALDIRERALGREHPYFAYSLNSLAENHFLQGDLALAETYFLQALTVREQTLILHPQIASSCYNLARLYLAQGRFTEAESFCKRAVDIREQTLGKSHPDTLSVRELYMQILHLDTIKRNGSIADK